MTAILLPEIKRTVLQKLKGLDTRLTYHSAFHTLDVLEQAEHIATAEGLEGTEEALLLKVAALYHDTGFLRAYNGHEKMSCTIFLEDADRFGFTQEQKDTIVDLIMMTQIPQRPETLLEKIICDADLDYLGRKDFAELAEKLHEEFLNYQVVANNSEWDAMQLKFLSTHHYHTKSSQSKRGLVKQLNLANLIYTEPD